MLRERPEVERAINQLVVGEGYRVQWGREEHAVGFRGVSETVWNFHIGGYQVCEKWLKDRKGLTLTREDIEHYQKIVVALSETIRIMAEIDAVIEQHGGWPLVGSVMERSE